MRTPNLFIAYAPRGAGLRCMLAYLSSARDVYGWFTGPRHDASVASEFFVLAGLYTAGAARYDAVPSEALHSGWSLEEARRHELAAMQETLSREWLVYRHDPDAASELQAYAEAELAAGEVNLRFARLAKLDTRQPNWTFYSKAFQRTVLRQVAKRWPLEYRPHGDEVAAAQKRRAATRARP